MVSISFKYIIITKNIHPILCKLWSIQAIPGTIYNNYHEVSRYLHLDIKRTNRIINILDFSQKIHIYIHTLKLLCNSIVTFLALPKHIHIYIHPQIQRYIHIYIYILHINANFCCIPINILKYILLYWLLFHTFNTSIIT